MNQFCDATAGDVVKDQSGPVESETIIRGLERKLDVLRAQLAASIAGEDVGKAGVAHWSRLEDQSQKNQQLELKLNLAIAERDTALSQLKILKYAADHRREVDQLLRSAVSLELELERARQEILNCQRENLLLNRALETAIKPPQIIEVLVRHNSEDMLDAMLASTCWRITAPLRIVGEALKRLRHFAPQ